MTQSRFPRPPSPASNTKRPLCTAGSHRRLRLAARQRESRGHRLPRGRKRLCRGGDGPAGRPARRALPGMLCHMKQTDVSVPYHDGAWWYYTRTEEGQQYAIHCRTRPAAMARRTTPGAGPSGRQPARPGPRLLLHRRHGHQRRRPLAGLHHRHHRLSPIHPAYQGPGHRRNAARRSRARRLRGLGRRQLHPLLYRRGRGAEAPIPALAPHARHAARRDALVFQDDDERFNLGAGRTRDGKYIVLESASHTTSESWVLAADEPMANSRLSARARTSTSTPSTTATASGSSAPTIEGATSAWSPRPQRRPAANIGPS